MIETELGNTYYCPECDDFHLLNEFIKTGYGFSCPITKTEIKYWKHDEYSDCQKVAKLLNFE